MNNPIERSIIEELRLLPPKRVTEVEGLSIFSGTRPSTQFGQTGGTNVQGRLYSYMGRR